MVKVKSRINAVDIFLILFAVSILAATFMRSGYVLNLIFGNTYNVTYTVDLKSVDEELAETVSIGEKIHSKQDGAVLGEIIDIEIEQTQTTITTASGSNVVGFLEDKVDMTVTVNADVIKSDSKYIVGNDTLLGVGNELYVVVGEIYAKATITDVRFAEITKK